VASSRKCDFCLRLRGTIDRRIHTKNYNTNTKNYKILQFVMSFAFFAICDKISEINESSAEKRSPSTTFEYSCAATVKCIIIVL